MFRLQDKHAVVTGGGSGIGRAVSLLFARQGAVVHMLDRSADAMRSVVDEAGGDLRMHAHECDVTDLDAVWSLMESIGRIDVLVNSAGISHIGRADDTTVEDFDRVYNVNVKGVYHCLHAAIPVMRAGGGGVILNVCSIAATCGLSDRFAYSMSKGAVLSMTFSVAKDYLKDNIRCNCISPARVHTPFVDGFLAKNYPGREEEMFERLSKSQPIGRMAKPEEVAHAALYLCSDESAFLTGCDYPVDGGFLRLNT